MPKPRKMGPGEGNANAEKHGVFSRYILEGVFTVPEGKEALAEYLAEVQARIEAEWGREEVGTARELFLRVLLLKLKRFLLLDEYLDSQGSPDPKGLSNWASLAQGLDRSLLALGLEKPKPKDNTPEDERPLDAVGLRKFYQSKGLM